MYNKKDLEKLFEGKVSLDAVDYWQTDNGLWVLELAFTDAYFDCEVSEYIENLTEQELEQAHNDALEIHNKKEEYKSEHSFLSYFKTPVIDRVVARKVFNLKTELGKEEK